MRGANKAAEEAARDAEGAWPLDEEGHLIEEPNLFDIKFDDAYTEVPSGPWAETALQMVTGVGANGTSVSLAIMLRSERLQNPRLHAEGGGDAGVRSDSG